MHQELDDLDIYESFQYNISFRRPSILKGQSHNF